MKSFTNTFLWCFTVFGFGSLAFGANGTTIGTLSLLPTFQNIGVVCTYSGDDNSNMTAIVQYKPTAAATWSTAHAPHIDRRATVLSRVGSQTEMQKVGNARQYEIRTSIFELTRATAYDVKVIFTDEDGVKGANPTSTETSTWTHDQRTSDGTTKTVCYSGCDYTTIANALSASSAGDIVSVGPGTYSGFTISTNGTNDAYIKIKATDDTNMPTINSLVTLSGDYVELEHLKITGDIDFRDTARYVVISNCEISKTSPSNTGRIKMSTDVTGALIENCRFNCTDGATGTEHEKATGIYQKRASIGRIVVRYNTFINCYDAVGGEGNAYIGAGPDDSSDFHNNSISKGADDGLEIEGDCINVRIYNNRITDINLVANRGSPLATNPIIYGPLFAYNNVLVRPREYTLKVGRGTGPGYIYNNTFVGGQEAVYDADFPGQTNLVFINNILQGTTRVYQSCGENYRSDYNMIDTAHGSQKVRWGFRCEEGSYTDYGSLGSFSSGTGQDGNSFVGEPRFYNYAGDDFSLTSNSPCIDKGKPGTNLGFTKDILGNTRSGRFDIGAYEYLSPGSCATRTNQKGNLQGEKPQ